MGRGRHGRSRVDDRGDADEGEARAPGPAVRAVEVLDAARTLGEGFGGLVFPMRSGKPISASTLPKMLQHHRIAAVAHGAGADADRLREPRSGHQRVDGRAGQRGHVQYVAEG